MMLKKEPDDVVKIECRSCGEMREFAEFRVFSTNPTKYMDFCVYCERKYGTLTLYRRYPAYGTAEIISAVYAAERVDTSKRSPDQVRLLFAAKTDKEPLDKTAAMERELARRELCRRRLIYFTTTFDGTYKPGWVHQDIARRLERFMERVESNDSPRLMLFLPPRAGKSRLASDMFPSWALGHHPDWEIIEASYGQELPVQFSRNIRDRLRDPEYQAIFDATRLRTDSQGVESWRTTRAGGYTAAGVGVGITGKGFRLGILDDPLKDHEAAQSEVIRESTWNWYQSVFRTRAAPGAGILVVLTRWHDSDPAGMLLQRDQEMIKLGVPAQERENWEVVSYPAIAEADEYLMPDGEIHRGDIPDTAPLRLLRTKGEALHPERYPLRELLRLKNTVAPQIWSAMYQQNPTPDDGEFFKRSDFKYRLFDKEYIAQARTFMTVDYAISKRERNDFTVMGVFALDNDDNLFLLDIRRGRWGTYDIARNVVALVEKWKPEIYAGERGAIHEAVWPVIKKELGEKRLYISVNDTLVPIQDKETRARPIQGRMQHGKMFFSYADADRPDTVIEMERELLRFPNGTNDDIVDMLAWGGRLALTVSPRSKPKPKKRKSWFDDVGRAGSDTTFMAA